MLNEFWSASSANILKHGPKEQEDQSVAVVCCLRTVTDRRIFTCIILAHILATILWFLLSATFIYSYSCRCVLSLCLINGHDDDDWICTLVFSQTVIVYTERSEFCWIVCSNYFWLLYSVWISSVCLSVSLCLCMSISCLYVSICLSVCLYISVCLCL